MRIAMTGAAGLTGSAVARALLEQGHEVVAIVRNHPAASGMEHRTADCRDIDTLAGAIAGADVLVHGAGIALGASVADAVRRAGVGRVVAISSAAVYTRHRAAAVAYRAGEDALHQLPVSTLFVRPTMIYGSKRDRNVHRVLAFARRFRFLPVPGTAKARIQPIHFADLANAIAELTPTGHQGVVDAGGGDALSIRDAAIAMLDALGLPPRLAPVPVPAARAALRVAEAITGSRLVERLERSLEDRTVDNARLVRLTSVRPRPFRTGVRDQVRAGT